MANSHTRWGWERATRASQSPLWEATSTRMRWADIEVASKKHPETSKSTHETHWRTRRSRGDIASEICLYAESTVYPPDVAVSLSILTSVRKCWCLYKNCDLSIQNDTTGSALSSGLSHPVLYALVCSQSSARRMLRQCSSTSVVLEKK